jgi:hypothetical protein
VRTHRHLEYSNDLVASVTEQCGFHADASSEDTVASSVLCEIPTDVESSVFIP